MAKPTKLAHVVYMTRRFDEMLAWYKTVFDTRVQCENPAFAFVTYDDEHHRFAFVNMSAIAPDSVAGTQPHGIGVNHVGYTYANLGDLLETYDRLKQLGIKPYWEVHHGVTLSMYYQDPDGNRMEFQVDCYPNADAAHVFMQSEAFAANPVGVNIHLDELLAQYRSGVSVDSLMLQPDGPAAPIPQAHGMS
jgi:catechol-2,3-dioxygenase